MNRYSMIFNIYGQRTRASSSTRCFLIASGLNDIVFIVYFTISAIIIRKHHSTTFCDKEISIKLNYVRFRAKNEEKLLRD